MRGCVDEHGSRVIIRLLLGLLSIAAVFFLGTFSSSTSTSQWKRSFASLRRTNSSNIIIPEEQQQLHGVTGTLFAGERVRSFQGPLRFREKQQLKENELLSSADVFLRKKWAVCTTIHAPTQAILDFVMQEDWAIVIVGDQGMAPFHVDGVHTVFLDVTAQLAMARDHDDFFKLLPWEHFGRKNIGYLYAIMHGAELIWDFDDDNFMKDAVMPPPVPSNLSSIYDVKLDHECVAFNPLPLMGGDASVNPMWPRGFPLDLIHQPCNYTLQPADGKEIGVFQSLADHEPDVDGIYRLTRMTPMTFQPTDKILVMPQGTFSPYNAQATLVTKPAFWSLLLPVSVHGRVSDIWRSYTAQRLLWDIGLKIAFVPPMVHQYRNVHNPRADMEAEQDLYRKSMALVTHLQHWQGTAPTLGGRLEELVIDLYERKYLEESDVLLTQQWLMALSRIGYDFPPLDTQSAFVPPDMSPDLLCPRPTRVLVTGISGMIGSHVARVLMEKPCYKIYGLIRPRSNLDTLVGILDQLHLVTGDITDQTRMMTLLEEIRPEYIYHFAAQAVNAISYDVPELTLDTNVIGTMNILEGVRRLGLQPRILLAGSSTEYGRTADTWDGPIPESAPLDPVSPYGVSKLTTEKLGNQYFASFGIKVITARFFIQVGVGGTDSLAIHQFCKQIAMAEAGLTEPILRHGNLGTARDMTDCRDSAPVVVELAEKGLLGEAYNIGSGTAMTIQSLLDIAMSFSHLPMKSVSDASRFRVYDEKVLLSDNRKVRDLTGWKPNVNMDDTVASILKYWRRRITSLYDVKEVEVDEGSSQVLRSQSPVIESTQNTSLCPTANIDIFLVTFRRDFPITSFLMRSLETFMPCHGHVHVLIDEQDVLTLGAWVDVQDPRIHIHIFRVPEFLSFLPGYIAQAWIMMWADRFAKETKSNADFMMFMDTDSLFGLRVTCRSLFDKEGKVYVAGWNVAPQIQFVPCIEDMIGKPANTSYMSYFPFTMPISSFERMRNHIIQRLGGENFDSAFADWCHRPGIDVNAFSQFAVMGTYMERYEQDRVHAMYCDSYGNHTGSECAQWIPPASHLSWRPCAYVDGCASGSVTEYFSDRPNRDFNMYTIKFTPQMADITEKIIMDGTCVSHFMKEGTIKSGCTEEQSKNVNAELLPYPKDPPPYDVIRETYSLDHSTEGLCYSVENAMRKPES